MGIGRDACVVKAAAAGRFKEVADELGLTGQRLGWAVRGMRLLVAAAEAAPGSRDQDKRISVCERVAHRAAAALRAARRLSSREGEQQYLDVKIILLSTLSRARLWRHGRPPFLTRIKAGASVEQCQELNSLVTQGAAALEQLANWHRDAVKARRRFAAGADLRTAHRVSKVNDFVSRRTASASKSHQGEATDQMAADRGLREWTLAWKGASEDHREQLLRVLDDLYALGRAEEDDEELILTPWMMRSSCDASHPGSRETLDLARTG